MRQRFRWAMFVAVAAMTGCQPVPAPVPLPPGDPDACRASAMQDFVGQRESVLYATNFVVPIRVIRPGTAVTMDYIATRMNFEIDRSGRIARVFCG
jgi:hypothetical protein